MNTHENTDIRESGEDTYQAYICVKNNVYFCILHSYFRLNIIIFKTVDLVPPATKQTHVCYHTIWLNNFKSAGVNLYQADYHMY